MIGIDFSDAGWYNDRKGGAFMTGKYDDIINLERPVSRKHSPMPMEERAAQFSPFAALTGYDDVISEAARLTARPVELSEDAGKELDEQLVLLAAKTEAPEALAAVELTWFVEDGLKLGGEYVTRTVTVRRVDRTYRLLELEDRSVIPMDVILNIRFPEN